MSSSLTHLDTSETERICDCPILLTYVAATREGNTDKRSYRLNKIFGDWTAADNFHRMSSAIAHLDTSETLC